MALLSMKERRKKSFVILAPVESSSSLENNWEAFIGTTATSTPLSDNGGAVSRNEDSDVTLSSDEFVDLRSSSLLEETVGSEVGLEVVSMSYEPYFFVTQKARLFFTS